MYVGFFFEKSLIGVWILKIKYYLCTRIKTKNMKDILLVIVLRLFFFTVIVSLVSCSPDYIPSSDEVQHTIHISNEGKPFEYWLNKVHYDSEGQEIKVIVDSGTQITLSAIVPVINGVSISPNFQVYQDSRIVELKKVTIGFFWYKVK
jgi:hypothetical protein